MSLRHHLTARWPGTQGKSHRVDAPHHGLVRKRARAVLEVEGGRAEGAHGRGDLPGDRLGRADVQRALGEDVAEDLRLRSQAAVGGGGQPTLEAIVVGGRVLAHHVVATACGTPRRKP